MQELVWQIANNLDIEAARKIPKNVRSPFIEDSATEPDLQFSDGGVGIMDSVDQTENSPSPRWSIFALSEISVDGWIM